MYRLHKLFVLFFIILLTACRSGEKDVRFVMLSPDETNISFVNRVSMTDTFNILHYMYFFNGGGVAIGDFNNDGWEDVYLTGNQTSSRLYLNKGGFTFEDITTLAGVETTGWASGVTLADVNADGWLDLYVCRTGSPHASQRANLLFINNGDLTFTEQAAAYGIDATDYTTHAAFFDYDRDGDLDLYLLNHSHQFSNTNQPRPRKLKGESANTDRLFRNDPDPDTGHPYYTDVSKDAGIQVEGFGLGLAISDINGDNWPDIYVSNDFITNDLLYINQQDGTFSNDIASLLKHQTHNSMGNDIADFNNDSRPDIFVADMLPVRNKRRKLMMMNTGYERFQIMLAMGYEPQYTRNTLQLNNGKLEGEQLPFSEIGQLSGVHASDWSWSTLFADLDNDGWKDLLVTNGHLKDLTDLDFIAYRKDRTRFTTQDQRDSFYLDLLGKMPGVHLVNHLFQNNRDLTFTDVSGKWGFNRPSYSNGSALADLDNDGDLDLVVNNLNEEAFVYRNTGSENAYREHHYLQLQLTSADPSLLVNGTKIRVYTPGNTQYFEYYRDRGYQSCLSGIVHIGLGQNPAVDSLVITWPDDTQEVLKQIPADQRITLQREDSRDTKSLQVDNASGSIPIFTRVYPSIVPDYRHMDDEFPDYNLERLLPHQFSRGGPCLAVADVNRDGLGDFFTGGSSGYAGQLFIQQTGGGFTRRDLSVDTAFEDQGALFFDADSDGDADLYVVSGGNENWARPDLFQDRLYKNDGNGQFYRDTAALPALLSSGSCVTAADFDRDGDPDLFIGGRVVPGAYGASPDSYLLVNEGGTFRDGTEEFTPGLKKAGMVTTALWTDFNNDEWVDLIVTGEWMPILFFENDKGVLERVEPAGLPHTEGWWNSIVAADFDRDGDMDYVLGNRGLNADITASPDHPVTLHAGYYDNNPNWDFIFSHYRVDENGSLASFPYHARNDLIAQMPLLQKKFNNHESYSTARLEDILTPAQIADARVLSAYRFESVYLENIGPQGFALHNLPVEAQLAPINGILPGDFNRDGHTDLLTVGNFYGQDVTMGRQDASLGLLLKGDGTGGFEPVPASQSGFRVDGDARSLMQLWYQYRPVCVAGQNRGTLVFYSLAPRAVN